MSDRTDKLFKETINVKVCLLQAKAEALMNEITELSKQIKKSEHENHYKDAALYQRIEASKKPVVPEPHSIFKVDWKKASEESPKENIYDSCGLLIVVESMSGQRWLDCSRWRDDRGFIDMDYFGCVVTHWAFMPDVPSQVYPYTLRWVDEVKKS